MGLSNAEIKKVNRNNILRYLLKSDIVSKNGIAYSLELTAPTVTSALKDLQDLGLIKEEGAMDSNGGRKSMGYSCNKDAKFAVGINISKNYVDLAIVNLVLEAVYTRHEKIQIRGNETSYKWLKEYISDAIEKARISRKKILGIGYALPAIIDESGTRIYGLHEEMDLPRNFYEIVREWFPYPAVLLREAVCAGSAVASDLDIEGEGINLGINCRKGEFGHLTLVPDGRQCFCGRKGCLNVYCSTDNLTVLTGGDLSLFFERLKEGKPEYTAVWDEYLKYLSLSIHNLMTCFDEKMILGGDLARYLRPYIEEIQRRVAAYDSYLKDISYLDIGALAFDASSIGAAAHFIEKFIAAV